MNTKAKFNEEELQDIWSALQYFITVNHFDGAKETRKAMRKIIKKIREKPRR